MAKTAASSRRARTTSRRKAPSAKVATGFSKQAVRLRLNQLCADKSYRELGDIAVMTGETVRRQLTGESAISIKLISAVCRHFGVSADWVFFGKGSGAPTKGKR
ncbi:MAG: hypothetical protein KF866_11350 [Phycisphaeraceae bacterium]|nr:hypothetical protein [Phycisphaeraceae bacterium]MCW5754230.1 hypothetical protein [Phycisphaeraceae bacterium]